MCHYIHEGEVMSKEAKWRQMNLNFKGEGMFKGKVGRSGRLMRILGKDLK